MKHISGHRVESVPTPDIGYIQYKNALTLACHFCQLAKSKLLHIFLFVHPFPVRPVRFRVLWILREHPGVFTLLLLHVNCRPIASHQSLRLLNLHMIWKTLALHWMCREAASVDGIFFIMCEKFLCNSSVQNSTAGDERHPSSHTPNLLMLQQNVNMSLLVLFGCYIEDAACPLTLQSHPFNNSATPHRDLRKTGSQGSCSPHWISLD